MMNEQEIDALLSERGYRRIASPYPDCWRGWLWVEPIRPDGIPTKLCQWWGSGMEPESLNWLLDHYCELKGEYYSDEQRANNRRASILPQGSV